MLVSLWGEKKWTDLEKKEMELFRQLPYDIQCSVMRYTPHPCAAIIKADARFRGTDDFTWDRPQPLVVFDCCVVYGPPTFNVRDRFGDLLENPSQRLI